MNMRRLWCLFTNGTTSFSVEVPDDCLIDDLKTHILNKAFPGSTSPSPTQITLWKLNEPEVIKPERGLWQRIEMRGPDLSQYSTMLESSDEVGEYFPHASKQNLDIIVQLPLSIASERLIREQANPDVEGHIHVLLQNLRQELPEYVRVKIKTQTWQAPDGSDPEWAEHIRSLDIPILNLQPSLLLHGIGDTKWHQHDPQLMDRVSTIFRPGQHVYLVNTSGSGKTRLMFEGLAHNWGMYLSCAIDLTGIGSRDLQNLLNNDVPTHPEFTISLPEKAPDYKVLVARNRIIVRRYLRRIILARLLVLHAFLCVAQRELSENFQESQALLRLNWLMMQLFPTQVFSKSVRRGTDVFLAIGRHIDSLSDNLVNIKIQDTMSLILSIICESSLGTNLVVTNSHCLFCCIDEAQIAATEGLDAFRGKLDAKRPYLREFASVLRDVDGITMFVTGTGLSLKVVRETLESGIGKPEIVQGVYDTGWFGDSDAQRRYLSLYIPQSYLNSTPGLRLSNRMARWVRGRHRFTATFLQMLLQSGLTSANRLLNSYIHDYTQIKVSDADVDIAAEPQLPVMKTLLRPFDFEKLKSEVQVWMLIQSLLFRYLIRGDLLVLSEDEHQLVECGFARFICNNGVRMDEPLALLAASRWFQGQHTSIQSYVQSLVRQADARGSGFEDLLATYFLQIFGTATQLDQVLEFIGDHPPTWASEQAELVAMTKTDNGWSGHNFSMSHVSQHCIGTNATSYVDDLRWFEDTHKTPFLFPSNNMGPDLIFVLRLQSDRYFWVVVQAKYNSENKLGPQAQQKALESVTPSQFYVKKDGEHHAYQACPDLKQRLDQHLRMLPSWGMSNGVHNLLRVIATFPAHLDLETSEDTDEHPLASLKMNLVENSFPILHALLQQKLTKRKANGVNEGEGRPNAKKRRI